jgi:hypothetical protein
VFVEVGGEGKFPSHALSQLAGELRAIVQGHSFHRNEGAHIRGPHARVGAVMGGHVEHLRGGLHGLESRFQHGGGTADEGDDGPVGIGAGIHVQKPDPRHRFDGVGDLADSRHVPALGEVGDAFDHLVSHGKTSRWKTEKIVRTDVRL